MIVFVLAGFAIAQQETGRIVGTVRDQSNRYRFSAGAGLKLQHGWKWKIGACPDWR
jgi:hypothetical protein